VTVSLVKYQKRDAHDKKSNHDGDVVMSPIAQSLGRETASRPERSEPSELRVAVASGHECTEHRVEPDPDKSHTEKNTKQSVNFHLGNRAPFNRPG